MATPLVRSPRHDVFGNALNDAGELVAFVKGQCRLADREPALPEYVFAWTEIYEQAGRMQTEERQVEVYATHLVAALEALGFPSRGGSLGPCGHVFPLIGEWLRRGGHSNLTVFIRGGSGPVLEEVSPPAFYELAELALN